MGLWCALALAQSKDAAPTYQLVNLSTGNQASARKMVHPDFPVRETAGPRSMDPPVMCTNTSPVLLGTVTSRHSLRHATRIWKVRDYAFFFVSGMAIDADGAPNAYNPEDTGLDELANAGSPLHWDGIIDDRNGFPLIQQESDPFPGYYISCTSLADQTKGIADPTRYVDASQIPYVALPKEIADRGGARLGDFAFVVNLRNGKASFAIYADIGTVGEGSIALADRLGIPSDARRGGASAGILYVFFPGSGNLQPRGISEIQNEGEKLLYRSARSRHFSSCLAELGIASILQP